MANPAYTVEPDRYMSAAHAHWPARYATALTPSDSVAVAVGPGGVYAKRLFVGVTGDVNLITAGDNGNGGLGTAVLYKAVPAGTYLNVQVRTLLATGTTATNIVGEAD
jgi:hypothetical protein